MNKILAVRFTLLMLLVAFFSGEVFARKIPFPIVFVHGLGGKAESWEKVVDQLIESEQLTLAGFVKHNGVNDYPYVDHQNGKAFDDNGDVFVVQFSDNQAAIDTQASELKSMIKKILEISAAEKIILVGHSMGGLVSRVYLIKNPASHKVYKLLTVVSPNQGSNWAKLSPTFHKGNHHCETSLTVSGFLCRIRNLTEVTSNKIKEFLDDINITNLIERAVDLDLNSRALGDLMPALWKVDQPPADFVDFTTDSYLSVCYKKLREKSPMETREMYNYCPEISRSDWRKVKLEPLNKMAAYSMADHPTDVLYTSIVGQVILPRDPSELLEMIKKLISEIANDNYQITPNKLTLFTLIRVYIEHLQGKAVGVPSGDGAVDVTSQNMANLLHFYMNTTSLRSWPREDGKTELVKIKGLDQLMKVEWYYVDHMQVRNYPQYLKRALEEPALLKLETPPNSVEEPKVTIKGTLVDVLLKQEQLKLYRVHGNKASLEPATIKFKNDLQEFEIVDIELVEGENEFKLAYERPIDLPYAKEHQASFTIKYERKQWLTISSKEVEDKVWFGAIIVLVMSLVLFGFVKIIFYKSK